VPGTKRKAGATKTQHQEPAGMIRVPVQPVSGENVCVAS